MNLALPGYPRTTFFHVVWRESITTSPSNTLDVTSSFFEQTCDRKKKGYVRFGSSWGRIIKWLGRLGLCKPLSVYLLNGLASAGRVLSPKIHENELAILNVDVYTCIYRLILSKER